MNQYFNKLGSSWNLRQVSECQRNWIWWINLVILSFSSHRLLSPLSPFPQKIKISRINLFFIVMMIFVNVPTKFSILLLYLLLLDRRHQLIGQRNFPYNWCMEYWNWLSGWSENLINQLMFAKKPVRKLFGLNSIEDWNRFIKRKPLLRLMVSRKALNRSVNLRVLFSIQSKNEKMRDKRSW